MIYSIEGKVSFRDKDSICLTTTTGMTYQIIATLGVRNSYSLNENALIYTYLRVRDDRMELYGFKTRNEREAFTILINISSVGPKTAIAILNTFSYDELLKIVGEENVKKLTAVSGIGKKSAGRIILELSGKLINLSGAEVVLKGEFNDAKQGLLGMGFDREYIDEKLAKLKKENPEMDAKEIMKRVLKDGK